MSVETLLGIAKQMAAGFPQAELLADGCPVRDVRVSICYGADGKASSAVLDLMIEKEEQ